ncbi:MAG: TonB-dependent receptor [Pseudomonas sp.]
MKSVSVSADRATEKSATGALGSKSDLDTPFSTASKSSLEIEKLQAASLAELFQSDSSITRSGSDYNGYATRGLTLRGLPLDIYSSMKIDGLPGGFLYGVNLPLEDMDQVQVLKGAAGFMYGFSAPGGIVNYTLKKPTDSTFLSFDVGYRSSNLYSQHLDAGGRLFGDGLIGYRLNLSREEGTSYTGSGVNRKAMSLTLDGKLSSNLSWSASLLAQERNIDHPTQIFYTSKYTASVLPKALDGSSNWSADQDRNDTKFFYATAGLKWTINERWNLRLDASRAHTNYRLSQEYLYLTTKSGGYLDYTFDGLDTATDEYGQALLEGSFETGALSHNIVAGVSRLHRGLDFGGSNYSPGSVSRASGNLYDPTQISWSPITGDPNAYRVETTNQTAGFLSDTIDFLDAWSLLAGWRYNNYQDISIKSYTGDGAGHLSNITYSKYGKEVVTPTYALLYKPAPGHTLYASYVESLEQGSTVGSSYANYGETLAPLVSKQYELGYKAEKGAWNAAAAIFRVERGAEYANAQNYYVQDGLIRYDGGEISADRAITDSVRLGGSVTYLNARYVETGTAWLIGKAPAGINNLVAAANIDYRPAFAPRWSFYANARYVSKGVAANNSTYQIVVKAPAYHLVDIGTGYQMDLGAHRLSFHLGINNLFNEHYWQVGSSSLALGAPRVYSFNVKYDW